MADQLNSKKTEGDEIYGQLRNYSLFVEDSVLQIAAALKDMNSIDIPRMEREHVDLESDLHRMEELNVKYAPTTREFLQNWSQFDQAMNDRIAQRGKMLKIRNELPTKIGEIEPDEINMEEVEELCRTLEKKDRQLMLDLIQLRDVQLNQKQIDAQGFHPDSATVSSILVRDVIAAS
jgi:hypothetical protein